jgi:hypothetical protein
MTNRVVGWAALVWCSCFQAALLIAQVTDSSTTCNGCASPEESIRASQDSIVHSALQRGLAFGPALAGGSLRQSHQSGTSGQFWLGVFSARVRPNLRFEWQYNSIMQRSRFRESAARLTSWGVTMGEMFVLHPPSTRFLPYVHGGLGLFRSAVWYKRLGTSDPDPDPAAYRSYTGGGQAGFGVLIKGPAVGLLSVNLPLMAEISAQYVPKRLTFPIGFGVHF